MKLDTKAMRHLTAEDWRVLAAVRPLSYCYQSQMNHG